MKQQWQCRRLRERRTTSRRWAARLPRTSKDRHGSTVENTHTRPSVIPSASAIALARSSLDSPERFVDASARCSSGLPASAAIRSMWERSSAVIFST